MRNGRRASSRSRSRSPSGATEIAESNGSLNQARRPPPLPTQRHQQQQEPPLTASRLLAVMAEFQSQLHAALRVLQCNLAAQMGRMIRAIFGGPHAASDEELQGFFMNGVASGEQEARTSPFPNEFTV